MTRDDAPDPREELLGYSAAVIAVSIAALLRMLADGWLGESHVLVAFFGAIAAATWFGGYRPAIVAAVLSYLVANYLFIPPRNAFGLAGLADALGLGLYVISAAAIILLGDRVRRTSRDASSRSEMLERVMDGADIVGWEWRRSARHVRLTRNAPRILRLPEHVPGPLALLRHFDPRDRRAFVRALRERTVGTRKLSLSARIARPGDGAAVWVRCQADADLHPDGRLAGVRGVFIDETQRIESETSVRHAEAQFRQSHDRSLRGYSLFSSVRTPDGEIVDFNWDYINPAGARLTRRRVSDLVGNSFMNVLPDVPARNEMFSRMRKVAESGEAEDVDLYYEVRGLRGWFRNMIVKANDGVAVEFFDITDRIALEDELRKKAAELKQSDERKNDFLALLAHELRNPLAPVRTGIQVIRMQAKDARLDSVVSILERQVLHIVRLIDDLLDVTRIDRGKLELHRERILLADVVKRGIELSQPNIDARQHALITELEIPHVYLDVDPTRMAQAIGNLLNNAAKFMAPGGRIWLSAVKRGAEASISIRDEGCGVPPQYLDRIFGRFVQLRADSPDTGAGLGLGLALVKSLVEMHGGRVSAYSEGANKGTEFTVRLPISLDVPDGMGQTPAEPKPAYSAAGTRILVVDDDRDTVDLFAQALSAMSLVVSTATDGEQALQEAERFVPAVMLIDLGMPGLDGYEIARRAREAAWGRKALLIALSGWAQEEDKEKALAAGFDYHLTKPVDVLSVIDLIETSERSRGGAARPAAGA